MNSKEWFRIISDGKGRRFRRIALTCVLLPFMPLKKASFYHQPLGNEYLNDLEPSLHNVLVHQWF